LIGYRSTPPPLVLPVRGREIRPNHMANCGPDSQDEVEIDAPILRIGLYPSPGT